MKAFTLFFFLIAFNIFSQNSDWVYRNPNPQNDFYSVKFFNQNTGYISGSGGVILKTTNGCASYQTLATGVTSALYDMYFASQQAGFAFGENSTIIYTSTGGSSWITIQQIPNSKTIKSVKFINPLTGYAAGTSGLLMKTINGGFNWGVIPAPSTLNLNTIFFQDANTGWIGADSGWIFKTTNGGNSWQGDSLSWRDNNYIYFIDALTGYLATGSESVGSGINLYKTTDSGNSWQSTGPYMTARNWYSVNFINQNTGFVIGMDAPVLVTTNGGAFWNIYGVPPGTTMHSISVVDSLVYICGTNGWISRMSQIGTQTVLGGTRNNFTSISFLNENTGMVVSGYQTLYTTNSGLNWNIKMYGSANWHEGHTTYAIWVGYFPSNNLYLISHTLNPAWFPAGSIIRSTDGGSTWGSGYSNYGSIEGMDEVNGTAYIAHTNSILKSTGGSWTQVYTLANTQLGDISFANENTGFVVNNNNGGNDGILKTTNGGGNWAFNSNPGNKEFKSIKLLPSGTGYGAGDSGYFAKTTNFGSIWQQMNTGLNQYNVDMKFVDDNNGWLLYFSGNWPYNYRLYFTKNGGTNFYPITSLGTFNVKSFSFLNANTGYVSGDSGVVLKTTNGGLTFINTSTGILPDNYSLSQNYPNPFNPVTNIKFDLPKSGFVKMTIYDLLGREITTLVNQQMHAGSYSADWDASSYPSGVYFYKIEIDDPSTSLRVTETKKMVLIK